MLHAMFSLVLTSALYPFEPVIVAPVLGGCRLLGDWFPLVRTTMGNSLHLGFLGFTMNPVWILHSVDVLFSLPKQDIR